MSRRSWRILLLVATATLLPSPELDAQLMESAPSLQLTYLGTAGWEIQDGNVTVLVDPYISRLKYGGGRHPAPQQNLRALFTRSIRITTWIFNSGYQTGSVGSQDIDVIDIAQIVDLDPEHPRPSGRPLHQTDIGSIDVRSDQITVFIIDEEIEVGVAVTHDKH